jgi:amino acid transporter
MASKSIFVREATGLVREFGPMMALMMAMNNMIGGGIWALSIAMPYTYPGSNPPLAFIIGLIPAFFFALSYAWMASSMPRAGGDYVFISRLVHPVLGYIVTFGNFLGRWFSVGFLLVTDVGLWGFALFLLGRGSGNAGLAAFGNYLATADPTTVILGAILLLLTVWFFLTIGGKVFAGYTAVIWFVPLVGSIIAILLSLGNPFNPAAYKAAWDALWGAGAYDEIANLAKNMPQNYTTPSFNATILAVSGAALFAYSGFHNPAQWSGEIKNPKRNLLIGIIGGTLISAVIYITLAVSAFYAGGNFILQYDYVYYTPALRSQLHIMPPIAPTLPMFAVLFAGGNVLLMFLIATAGAFSLYHVNPSALMMETRRVFAIAFDRFFPERFANVSERFHTPTWAIVFMMVGGILGIIISSPVLGPARALAGGINATFMYLIGFTLTGLALAILPKRKPAIYESIKTGALPIPPICGAIACILGAIFFVLNGSTLLPIGWSHPDIPISVLTLLIGLCLFAYYSRRNKKMGVDLKALLSEIPPE